MQEVQTPSAIELVRRFAQMRVLVIGDALLDSYLEGEAARLSRDGPIPVIRKTTELRLPGGAANVAANLHALGAHVSFLSVVGKDLAGELLRATLRERGIDDRWLLTDPTFSPPHKLRLVADGQHIARFDEGALSASASTPETQRRLLAHLEELYEGAHAIVFSDYGYGVLSQAVIQRLQSLLAPCPKVTLVDAQDLTRFRQVRATIVTPNSQEATRFVEGVTGRPSAPTGRPDDLIHVEQMARQIAAALSTEAVAITLAEQGVLLLDRCGHATHFPAHPVAVAHDVGAGASFASALTLALALPGPARLLMEAAWGIFSQRAPCQPVQELTSLRLIRGGDGPECKKRQEPGSTGVSSR